ncbi:MAG: DUF6089 family protein [Bacteroidia bacterium]
MSTVLKKISSIITFSVFVFSNSNAQKIEVGGQLGISNYWGDLAPTIAFNETRPAGGIFGRLNLNNTWALNAQLNILQVGGSDRNFTENTFRQLRFQNNITEFAALLEYNFINYGPYVLDKKFTTYVYTGLAGFMFKPRAQYNNQWYDLVDYKTEGVQYSRYSMAIPMGMGFKWMAYRNIALEGQIGFRRTFTDYLDDVSTVYPDMKAAADNGRLTQIFTDRSTEFSGGVPVNKTGYKRGNADYKDWYIFSSVTVAVRINSRVKCARFY